ncbi:electron transport complex subunit RsxC [Thiosulfativibrio zosterae]|uniref:Ion-translocating oxidoreductase complex subunit C n=1 Tax=Thiosulfativibrio zosterae TaxID=2675053 RepID=A0A6F8PMT3_9GAMM|nr:electron transport complex subunit RsxC [Thiosulfativibrio zosterae]BBP43378.1 electron transport complex subunit C [Thiosulfativibrio zosterae]
MKYTPIAIPKPKKRKPKLLLWFGEIYSYLYPMAKRWTHHFHGGVFPKYNKELSNSHPLKSDYIPQTLTLPLQQHVGVAAEPLVSVGERVLKNQRIADTDKGLSAPIHAPTSGIITAIENRVIPHVSGMSAPCIVITPDFKDEAIHNALAVNGEWPETPDALKTIVHNAGIVGMGGAGFPTFAKLPKKAGQIHTLLINGAECEPFITCDDLLMQIKAQEIVQGALIVAKALGSTKAICGIESNKPQAIAAMKKAAQGTLVEIRKVPTVYPMGGQKQLTQELTGIEIPAHAHAVDIGLLMMNVATYTAIYQAVVHGNPLTSRFVTVSGLGLNEPYNIDTLLGTSFEDLANQAKPKVALDYPLIMGGPMMGVKMPNNQVPVIKTTNCVLANPPEPVEEALPCIRCGECMDACPINLLPQQMYWYARAEEYQQVEKLKIADCIECGCCSFVCPSHIPLVQYYRHAKAEIKILKQEEKATELAKQRHEAKLARIEREQAEKEARLKAKKEAVKQQAADKAQAEPAPQSDKPKPAGGAAAAAARAAAARQKAAGKSHQHPVSDVAPGQATDLTAPVSAPNTAESVATAVPSARDKAIEAAKKRAATKAAAAVTPSQTEEASESTTPSAIAVRKAAMAAARQHTKTPNAEQSTANEPTLVDKRQAAVEAAKARALAKKQAAATPTEEATEPSTQIMAETAEPAEPSLVDKRQAAVEAAKARALAKKQAASPTTSTPEVAELLSSSADVKADLSDEPFAESTAVETPLMPTESAADKRKAAMAAAQQKAAERKAAQLAKSAQEDA